MDQRHSIAFGLSLRLVRVEDGGRRTALPGGHAIENRFTYRPNWVLPHMAPPEQTGAMVFGFDTAPVHPGQSVRAVILVFYPDMVTSWDQHVHVGTRLPMYEGPQAVGEGEVLWREAALLPLTDGQASRFDTWLGRSVED